MDVSDVLWAQPSSLSCAPPALCQAEALCFDDVDCPQLLQALGAQSWNEMLSNDLRVVHPCLGRDVVRDIVAQPTLEEGANGLARGVDGGAHSRQR
jgi:hypothetical protein